MKFAPVSSRRELPQAELPPAIASLQPRFVLVGRNGVDIVTRPFMDGGWGYNVPRTKADLPMPADCYSEPVRGVFWHGPC